MALSCSETLRSGSVQISFCMIELQLPLNQFRKASQETVCADGLGTLVVSTVPHDVQTVVQESTCEAASVHHCGVWLTPARPHPTALRYTRAYPLSYLHVQGRACSTGCIIAAAIYCSTGCTARQDLERSVAAGVRATGKEALVARAVSLCERARTLSYAYASYQRLHDMPMVLFAVQQCASTAALRPTSSGTTTLEPLAGGGYNARLVSMTSGSCSPAHRRLD